ncbi:MAG: hypothetical protein H6590_05280 [Flavobacteriales bacterium]|nr:hypothetical protein [Flavobacteriales bacterium]MCB9178816.1 hypothetical protein [Flavobacteriales bacterium]
MDFFRKSLPFDQEIGLLRTVLARLPMDVAGSLTLQVDAGLIRGSIPNASDIPGYCAFTYHGSVARRFENDESLDYTITGMLLRSNKLAILYTYTIYVSSGLLSGYSIQPSVGKAGIDMDWVDASMHRVDRESTNEAWEKARVILGEDRIKSFNPSAVHTVLVNGVEYFHMRDLEDGDFLGLGADGVLYVVTHDGNVSPWETKPLRGR